jgi:hypothetical protein
MLSPDKHIRKYFFDALKGFAPVFDEMGVDSTSKLYYVLRNQTKILLKENKCFDSWDADIVIEVVQRSLGTGNKGSRVVVNDLEQNVITAYGAVAIAGFDLINKEYNSNSFSVNGINEVLDRQIININLKLK